MNGNGLGIREKTRRFIGMILPSTEEKQKQADRDRQSLEFTEALERTVDSTDYKRSFEIILNEVRQELIREIIDPSSEDDRFAKGGVGALDRINEKIRSARAKGATALRRLKELEETENARRKQAGSRK